MRIKQYQLKRHLRTNLWSDNNLPPYALWFDVWPGLIRSWTLQCDIFCRRIWRLPDWRDTERLQIPVILTPPSWQVQPGLGKWSHSRHLDWTLFWPSDPVGDSDFSNQLGTCLSARRSRWFKLKGYNYPSSPSRKSTVKPWFKRKIRQPDFVS